MKKYYKYALWVIAFYFFTHFLIFVALNSNYKPIKIRENPASQISIEKAEATKIQGRIYGYIQNDENNNLNEKYIKLSVYDNKNELITTEYLKIENLSLNEKKAFEINYKAKNSTSYQIDIVNNK